MRRSAIGLLAAMLLCALPAAANAEAPVTVFAAASLTDALQDIAKLWVAQGHPAPVLSFGASSTLARQIEQGAPAASFASADEKWMDDLAAHGEVVAGTRRDLLSNALVLVVPAAHARKIAIGPDLDIAALLGPDGRLAVGDPAHVPVGIYAKQALTKLGLWDKVAPHLAPTPDVRAGLLLVERGEAPAGIVYATDAAVAPGVAVAGTFPASSHDPIAYPFAIVAGHDSPEVRALLAFLSGPEARAAFAKRGFGPAGKTE